MPRPRAADFEDKRRQIRAAAALLFAQKGYDRTAIGDIARACAMSKPLVYHYVASKEDLLVAIIADHIEDLTQRVRRAARRATPDGRLRAVAQALLDGYRQTDALHKIHINELSRLPAEAQASLMAVERELVAIFSDALLAAVPELHGSPRLTPVTMSLFGMLNWHCMWFRADGPMSREAYADLATGLIVAGARDLAGGAGVLAAE
ncbi:TetR/AcrR family transcriptional regulator [Phreatobacter cathodiphilus]|uniref:TetR/AcrR family transcriptional regulator n=1 Tax=Phreatobacter cathodiphilus TaxID=1868589 RepID=A0A2S0NCN8_9HYPH|nr:TetR/AcrR family transcriptional regulator [Phreatobacter cathodiphilus]AVO45915.1 TetR/AcrR family transcriptional regulator [Phreatobacter cathodiphilus]